jgi:hypothetical protein
MRGGESLRVDTFEGRKTGERSPNGPNNGPNHGSNHGSPFNGSGSPPGHKGNPLRSTLGIIFTLPIWFYQGKPTAKYVISTLSIWFITNNK